MINLKRNVKNKNKLKNINMDLPYNPAIPVLGIYTKESKASRDLNRYLCTSVQNSIIHNSQKVAVTQVSIDGPISTMRSIHTMEHSPV